MPSASGGSGPMSWKACEPAWRRGWLCTISVSGSTSNLVVLGWLSLICWSGDLNSHQAFKEVQDEIKVRLGTFEGETIWEENLQAHVPANASRPVARWYAERATGAPDRYLSVSSDHGRFLSNRRFFAAIKDLRRAPVEPAVDITQTGEHELQVRLEAPAYAYFVHLEVPHEATRFSNNYLDLEPRQERTISVTNEKRLLKAENVTVRWR